jgi:plasmid rolling circle replication initiator protein Rep
MSDSIPGGGSLSASSVSSSNDDSNTLPALSDVSDKDRPWDGHRANSDRISGHYNGTEFQSYSNRIRDCSQLLDFRLVPEQTEGAYKLKLAAVRLCHCRQCLICAWRRSLVYKARAYKVLPNVVQDFPTARYLFVTLTVKNCAISELRETLKFMNQSFARLSKLKDFPAIGYLRTTEVTKGRDGISAHPHFHCLLMVKASFFGRNYIQQSEWVAMWRKSLRVDYNPILDVQALKPESSPVALLAEIVKYQCKPNDIVLSEREWFLELTRQLHRTKAIAFGGVFKEYFRELEKEPTSEEMIGDDGEGEVDEGHLYFGWRRREKLYRMVDI